MVSKVLYTKSVTVRTIQTDIKTYNVNFILYLFDKYRNRLYNVTHTFFT